MKTEATKLTGHSPLQVLETSKISKEEGGLRIVYKNDSKSSQPSQQEDKVFQAGPGWDHSWFASYE